MLCEYLVSSCNICTYEGVYIIIRYALLKGLLDLCARMLEVGGLSLLAFGWKQLVSVSLFSGLWLPECTRIPGIFLLLCMSKLLIDVLFKQALQPELCYIIINILIG